jgi:D-alanyl-lipoteichoic acid acyltransferase DltB (MBOAT superfamily)
VIFNSYVFIFLFLPITFYVYFYLNSKHFTEASKVFLVFSSLFFYSWWNIAYLPIILASIVFNYYLGWMLSDKYNIYLLSKKKILIVGIISNIALLGYFKYTDFLITNINNAIDSHIALLHLSLPLAISFFTFQQIAYLVDSYRGETKEYNFLNYVNFVTFFPQLIAGPIVHHSEMMPQFSNITHKIKNYRNIALGLFIFSIGLFKKVVIADSFSIWVTQGFDVAKTLNLFEAWATSISYTVQLYFDFSGYTDMAIGIALLFNIKLPINFNSPYKAMNIQDFWRRWHITLSRFLKKYIYMPLGGNKRGNVNTYLNLLVTFIVGGLWHGASWTFVFWGFLHGVALITHRVWTQFGFKMNKYFAWFITFNFINIAWVFFRAHEWHDALKILKGMFDFSKINYSPMIVDIYNHTFRTISFVMPELVGGNQTHFVYQFKTYFWLIIVLIILFKFKNSQELMYSLDKSNMKISWAFYSAILFMCSLLFMSLYNYTEFIYFNF